MAHAPGVSPCIIGALSAGGSTVNVRYGPSIAANSAASRKRSLPHSPEPSSRFTARMPSARSSKPDHVTTIGSPASRPAATAPDGETMRDRTVTVPASSSRDTSSPCHR